MMEFEFFRDHAAALSNTLYNICVSAMERAALVAALNCIRFQFKFMGAFLDLPVFAFRQPAPGRKIAWLAA